MNSNLLLVKKIYRRGLPNSAWKYDCFLGYDGQSRSQDFKGDVDNVDSVDFYLSEHDVHHSEQGHDQRGLATASPTANANLFFLKI